MSSATREIVPFIVALLLAPVCLGGCAKSEHNGAADESVAPSKEVEAVRPATPETVSPTTPVPSAITIEPIYHGSLVLVHEGRRIYVDPWSKADLTRLAPADFILITDVHRDHLDPKAIEALRTDSTTIIAPKAVAAELAGVEVETLANGERREIAGLMVEAVPMYNRKRGPEEGGLFHDKGRGNGYVLTLGAERVYISGDTECTDEMRALVDIDLAFVCMNLPYTMPPSEAIPCIEAFKPKVVLPYHYRGSDIDEVVRAFADTPQIEVRVEEWYPGEAEKSDER